MESPREVSVKKRKPYPSAAQKARLVELLQADDLLRVGKFSPTFTNKTATTRWRNIEEELNSIPGTKKSWEEWRKTWQDMKAKVKRKQAVVRRSANLTGGGSPPQQLTAEEEKVLTTISESAVVGHSDSQESHVTFFVSKTETTVPLCVPTPPAPEQIYEIDLPCTDTLTVPVSPNNVIEIDYEEPHQNTHREREPSFKNKRSMAQTRLQKSLDVAVTLNENLKEKNNIKREFLTEMKKQTDAMNKQAEALSRQADALQCIAKCKAARASFYM